MKLRTQNQKASGNPVNRPGSVLGRGLMALVLAFGLVAVTGCENDDDPVEQLRDSAEEVREGVEEAANDTRRKIEDLQD